MKKFISLILILFIMVFASTSLAASGAKQYVNASIDKYYDVGPLAKLSGNTWIKGEDANSSITFVNTALVKKQNSQVYSYAGGNPISDSFVVQSRTTQSAAIYSAYAVSVAQICLRIRNPYYGTGQASKMTTNGVFNVYFNRDVF